MHENVGSLITSVRSKGLIKSSSHSVVLAITKADVDTEATLFRTYDQAEDFRGCSIWQVARATSAATTFFKSIKVGRDEIEFIDAGFGYNNPCEVLINEAQRQFPNRSSLQILSIGTGQGKIAEIDDSLTSILKTMAKMATTSMKVAKRLEDKYDGTGQYYRFNVERGLQDVTLSDWDKASKISAHTKNYLNENRRSVEKFVDAFTSSGDNAEKQKIEEQFRSR